MRREARTRDAGRKQPGLKPVASPHQTLWLPATLDPDQASHLFDPGLIGEPRLPTPLPLVPGEQKIGETIIEEARERQHRAVAKQGGDPALAGSCAPDRDCDIGADNEPALRVGRMQAATHVVERGAAGCKRIRLLVDVLEGDLARTDRREQLAALPVDAAVTDGAAGVVPDNKLMPGHFGLPHVKYRSDRRCASSNKSTDPGQMRALRGQRSMCPRSRVYFPVL